MWLGNEAISLTRIRRISFTLNFAIILVSRAGYINLEWFLVARTNHSNRARLRIASLWNGSEGKNSKADHHETDKCHGLFPVALLPNLLTSRAAFKPYDQCKGCGDCQRLIKKKDALFFLLVHFSNEIFAKPRVD